MIQLSNDALTETLYSLWVAIGLYDDGTIADIDEWDRSSLSEAYAVLYIEAVKRDLPVAQELPEEGWV